MTNIINIIGEVNSSNISYHKICSFYKDGIFHQQDGKHKKMILLALFKISSSQEVKKIIT